jgi:hypothetical protein
LTHCLPITTESANFADGAAISHHPGAVGQLAASEQGDRLAGHRRRIEGEAASVDQDDVKVQGLTRVVRDMTASVICASLHAADTNATPTTSDRRCAIPRRRGGRL